MEEFRQDPNRLFELLRMHKLLSRITRPPNIVFTGKTGNGKTSTINALFGKEVGTVVDTARGTVRPETHQWDFRGEHLNLIDLPGLGDGEDTDAEFRKHYQKVAPTADGIIIVVAPPRPAELGTIETVNCLLDAGLNPDKLIFGYNKIGDLRILDADSGARRRVDVDGVSGPRSPEDQAHVAKAIEDFVSSLNERCPKLKLTQSRVVAYDCDLGWNLYALLGAVLATLPLETLRHFDESTRAEREARKERETDSTKRARLEKEEDSFIDKIADAVMVAIDVVATKIPALPKEVYKAARPTAKKYLAKAIKNSKKWWSSIFG